MPILNRATRGEWGRGWVTWLRSKMRVLYNALVALYIYTYYMYKFINILDYPYVYMNEYINMHSAALSGLKP